MKLLGAPSIRDTKRSAEEIAAEVVRRLEAGPEGVDRLRDALVRIFARYCEILVERLNMAPEMHHLTFLGLLGAAPVPAVPARVPLSFKPVEWGGTPDEAPVVVVPAFTQVAAPPAEGDAEPVVFETTVDLELVRAELKRAVAADVSRQVFADADGIVSAEGSASTLLASAQPMDRAAHFSQSVILGLADISELRLAVDVEGVGASATSSEAEWGMQTPAGFVALTPDRDTTNGLSCGGEVVFRNLPAWSTQSIHSVESKWLTCRLRQPLATATGSAVARQSVRVTRISFAADYGAKQTPAEGAYWGLVPLDITRELYPFGERPRFGEVFHVRSQAFVSPGARVALHIELINPAGAVDTPIPAVSRSGKPRLQWEVFTSRGWKDVGAADGSRSLTRGGDVRFTVPTDAASTSVAGMEGGWLRARLVSGTYAESPREDAVLPFPAFTPPCIASLAVSASAEAGPAEPEHIVIESGLQYREIALLAEQPFDPFPADETQGLVLYLGLEAAASRELAGRAACFQVTPGHRPGPIFCREGSGGVGPELRWQIRGAGGWRDCTVEDGTRGMRYPGIVKVHLGGEVDEWIGSTLDPEHALFWLRILWDASEANEALIPQRLALNTVPAIQAMQLENELLGSSNGRPSQLFHTARRPVIEEVALEVREPDKPPVGESHAFDEDASGSVIRPVKGVIGARRETWVRWTRVPDFGSSGTRARHFTLDPLAGAVRFGDGAHGMIPSSGANNIRLRGYRSGGGKRGNRPVQTITQLRTTIPYVESVTNYESAAGGQETEDVESLHRSAAAWLRHRDRAVCADDYADLARKASPAVAKAMCVAARDLIRDPLSPVAVPGVVSVVVLPHSREPQPQPSFALVRRVKEFLDARRPAGMDLVVLGPEYVSIGIDVQIAVAPERSPAEAARECERRLSDFLHPVDGGPDRLGWGFGQQPHASDFYPLLGTVAGVDHIRSLRMRIEEARPGLLAYGGFLICSGNHRVQSCR